MSGRVLVGENQYFETRNANERLLDSMVTFSTHRPYPSIRKKHLILIEAFRVNL